MPEFCLTLQDVSIPLSSEEFDVTLPVLSSTDIDAAYKCLEEISNGSMGASAAMLNAGINWLPLRDEYNHNLSLLVDQINTYMDEIKPSMSPRDQSKKLREIAQFASEERIRIIENIRWKQGLLPTVTFMIRDKIKYGSWSRTYEDFEKKSINDFSSNKNNANKQIPYDDIYNNIKNTSTKSNPEVTNDMYNTARYLKSGGALVLVFSVSVSVDRILQAHGAERTKVIVEEGLGFVGGVDRGNGHGGGWYCFWTPRMGHRGRRTGGGSRIG